MKTRYAHPLLTGLASMAGLLQRGFTLATLFMAVCIYGNAQTLTELYKPYTYQGMPYRLMEPADCDSAKRYPVIVSLHGAGGRGEDNEKNLVKWAPQLTDPKVRSDYPAYVIFPQSKGMWNEQHLQNIKDIIKALPSVDMSRIYIMGQSMGGYGTYKMIGWDPEYFAAAAPVSGSGQGSASVIKDVPIWAFHGDADPRVPIKPDCNLFDEMKRIGGNMKFTAWPDMGHSTGAMFVPFVDNGITQLSSDRCDPEPVFLKWLFKQHRDMAPRQSLSAANRTPTPTVSPGGKVTFSLSAPKATEVLLGGDWGGERLPMVKDAKGNWTLDVQLKPQIYSYSFLVDGVKTLDPANPQLKLGRVSNASSVEVPGTPPMLWEMRDVPHGDIVSITYRSTAAGEQRRVTIYTPPGYQPDQATKLPVLYLLHGVGDTDSSWVQYGRANLIADNLLAEARMKPMIIVMPNGHAYKPGETTAPGTRPTSVFKEDLLETIMPLVEETYPVKTDQPNRAIMGLSMGGGQAFSIGLGNLDIFSHVGIFSAGGSSGSDVLAGLAADPTSANEKLKLLWIGCGRLDRGFESVQKLTDDLTKAGIRHTFKPTDGAHDWINWREYLAETLPLLFQ